MNFWLMSYYFMISILDYDLDLSYFSLLFRIFFGMFRFWIYLTPLIFQTFMISFLRIYWNYFGHFGLLWLNYCMMIFGLIFNIQLTFKYNVSETYLDHFRPILAQSIPQSHWLTVTFILKLYYPGEQHRVTFIFGHGIYWYDIDSLDSILHMVIICI